MVRTHQPGQEVFRSILSESIDWKPFSAFPPAARLAVLLESRVNRDLTSLESKCHLACG